MMRCGMKCGTSSLAACALIACVAGTMLFGSATPAPAAARTPAKAPAAGTTPNSRVASTRQFTGWVTAFDKTTLTVEKRGKQPRTVVFTRDADMSTTGDLEKDARVTVFYRDEGGQLTAHRVVVKPPSKRGGATRARGAASGASQARGTR